MGSPFLWGSLKNKLTSSTPNDLQYAVAEGANRGNGIVSVKDFGAVGDGVADDTAAIQAALDAVAVGDGAFIINTEIRGGVVLFPAGSYLVSSTLSGKAGSVLQGAGSQASRILSALTAGNVLHFVGVEGGHVDLVEIHGISVAQQVGVTHSSGSAIRIDGNSFGTTPRLRDVLTYGTYQGVDLDWCFPGSLRDVHAFAHTTTGFHTHYNCTSTTFQNCYAGANGGDGFRLAGNYLSLVGCASDSNGGSGYSFYYDGGVTNAVSLIACGAEANSGPGMSFDRSAGVSIYSPRIVAGPSSGGAVSIDGGDTFVITTPVWSASAASSDYALTIANASGGYPSNIHLHAVSSTASNFAGPVNLPDYVWWIGSRAEFGADRTGMRIGPLSNYTANLQSLFVGADFRAGSGGSVYGANFVPTVTTSYAGIAAAIRTRPVVNASGQTIARLAGFVVDAPSVTAGTVTRYEGFRAADMPAGASADASFVAGDGAVPVGRWSFCSTSSRENLFTGGLRIGSNTGPIHKSGAGTPEGVVTGPVGSTFARTDGGSGTSFYVKESGTGNTGWVPK